jgi:hypothetical protein
LLVKYSAYAHAIYIFITALWPLVHIESFIAVTGPKTDIWLVKTVGSLLIPISLTMVIHLKTNSGTGPLIVLGVTTAIAFICIDLYYALNNTISDIYLADAAIELFFLIGWILYGTKYLKHKKHSL